ncbi:MAG: M43 family zinc metalloprotease [Bacteroidota bacterium]
MTYDSLLQKRYPGWQSSKTALETKLFQHTNANLRLEDDEELVRIPIVVHVVHHESSKVVGVGGNISDEQIRSQITVLNEDYRRKPGTNGFNTNSVGADTEIEFFLATCDPNGKPSTGILRIYDTQTEFDINNDDTRLKSLSYWPSDQYLNIWIADLKTPFIGYTQFPDMSGLPGLSSSNGPAYTDGAVVDFKMFGRQTGAITSKLYNLGRTTTHEIGHWLGLLHTWGDVECSDGQCTCGDDHCNDTPPTSSPNDVGADNNCKSVNSNCNGQQTINMIENYLDYSPDKCMNIFTKDQKARMRNVLKTSPRRLALVQNSTKCLPLPSTEQLTIKVYPNPGNNKIDDLTLVEVQFKGTQTVYLQLYDVLGRLVVTKDYVELSSTVLSFSNGKLSAGMYFVVITNTGGEKAVKRLIVI